MTAAPHELYQPRRVTDCGGVDAPPLRMKVYGLAASGQTITDEMRAQATRFLTGDVVAKVSQMGDSNDLGFVIIHPGDWGVTIAAQWWVQGSVLCQHIYRKLHDAAEPMDTVTRPVVGCVWELAIIEAEQKIWRETMMQADPDPERYLARRLQDESV